MSQYVHELKQEAIEPEVNWKIIDRGNPYSPTTDVCQLCIKEKFYILYKPKMANLNHKSEIFNSCRHKKSVLLIKPVRKRKSPGS